MKKEVTGVRDKMIDIARMQQRALCVGSESPWNMFAKEQVQQDGMICLLVVWGYHPYQGELLTWVPSETHPS
jgi:hypothetical protein